MARLGILGGTFNPPHIAHAVCAAQARAGLSLDRVIVMPAGTPPHKPQDEDPGAEHRLAMCRLAAADQPAWLTVCELELRRQGPSYTLDTLRELHESHPGDELTLIVGGDTAWGLPGWHRPRAVLELAGLAVAERAEVRSEDLRAALSALGAGAAERLEFIDMPRLEISSTEIRRRVREGRPIDGLVAESVARYIAERGLYR